MLNIFSTLAKAARARKVAEDAQRWREDPLSHPALTTMDARQLADLPMNARRMAGEDRAAAGKPELTVIEGYSAARRLARNPPDWRFHSCA